MSRSIGPRRKFRRLQTRRMAGACVRGFDGPPFLALPRIVLPLHCGRTPRKWLLGPWPIAVSNLHVAAIERINSDFHWDFRRFNI
jgi:hypothetical protein